MEAMIFESHAHYDDEQFEEDRTELLNSMQENGIGTIINVGATFQSCTEVVQLAQEYPFIYAAVGVHPDEVGILDEEKFAYLREQCKKDKVVAVGEIGLDYYWDNESHEIQKKWFQRQLELAREFNLPVIIHSRDAAADTLEMMQQHAKGLRGVIHCFSYSKEIAQEYVKMGFTSVSEVLSHLRIARNSKKLWQIYRWKRFCWRRIRCILRRLRIEENAILL